MMKNLVRVLVLPVGLCAAATTAGAQEIAFRGMPWHIPADSARARLQAQGFAFRQAVESGDQAFAHPRGARLQVYYRDGRLVGVTLTDAVRGEAAQARFRFLADSLDGALGVPEEGGESARERTWPVGLASMRLRLYPIGEMAEVHLDWRGPGWLDERGRRGGLAPQPAGYITVSESQFMRLAVDTTVRGPRQAGALRGRFRIEYFSPVAPTVNGVAQDPFDAVEYELDFDCAGRRTRLVSRTTFLAGQRRPPTRPNGVAAWTTPQQPDGHYARGLAAVCRAAGREVR